MIRSVTIENFKSFERATLPLAPLTLLIGANASGKSNAIEAMQLLAWLASGRPLTDLLFAVREQELSLRGGFNDLATGQGREITLGCEVAKGFGAPPLRFSVTLGVTSEGLKVNTDSLASPERPVSWYHVVEPTSSPEGELLVEYESFRGTSPQIQCSALQAVFSQLASPARFTPEDGSSTRQLIPIACSHLGRSLLSLFFLDPDPRRMREYSFIQEKRLKRDGSALSSVLRRLTEEEGQKAKILEIIHALPEQDIRDITYLETTRGEVMVQLHETFGGKVVPREAALLSDGTLRVLAVATALFSVPPGSTLIIEEIDNGVHPSRAEHLLAQIQKVAKERGLRVLLTTHNPALLDAMPLEAIPDTVACYRDPERGDSRLVRLEDLESYPELIAQGPVGRLLTKGILDKYLKAPEARDREKKLARDLAWVEELRRQA